MRTAPAVRLATFAALALAGLTLSAQSGNRSTPPPAGQPQQPTFRAGVNTVRVDAVVTDRTGRPITDLEREDFEITEKGKRQEIANFKLIMLDGGLLTAPSDGVTRISSDAVEMEEAARDDVRLFTIFLDDYHVAPESARIVRSQLSRFVQTQLGPTDMVGVMYPLTPLSGIRMTRNHDSVVKALLQFEGRQGDYTPRNAIEEGYVRWGGLPPGGIEQVRTEVVLSALRGLTMHMGGMKPGRQTIVYVSEGFGPARGGTLLRDLADLAAIANRNHTAFYPLDPRIHPPRAQWTPGGTMDAFNFLAQHTGGRAIFDQTKTTAEHQERYKTYELPTSGLALAMKQMMIDASVYYLLGYNSSVQPDDKFHEIDVKVKRRNVEVRHREGYWARRN
jgi:VWFA-related protein